MQVAQKITLPLVLSTFAVLGVASSISVWQDISLQDEDMERDQRVSAQVLVNAVQSEATHESPDDALKLIDEANRDQDRVLFLFVPQAELRVRGALQSAQIAALDRGETLFVIDREVWGKASTWMPVALPQGTRGALWVQEPLVYQRSSLRRIVTTQITSALVLGAIWAVIAIGVGAVMIGRPMGKLAEQARRIGQGDLSNPLDIRQADEIGELANEMDKMKEQLAASRQRADAEAHARLEAQEQLRHADRLNTVGKLASGLAHEVGTPLNVIAARARMISTGEVSGDAANASARIVVQQTETITRIIRQLLDFARRSSPAKTHESLNALVSSTLTMLQPLAEKAKCRLVPKESAPVAVEIDRGQVQQALTNLVVNAVQAMPSGGQVAVDVGVERTRPPADVGGPEGAFAKVTVEDQGSGIDAELLPRIFEPFFTTKDVGEGTGLGLSVAWGIVRDHQGWIHVESEPGRGSRFSLFLPLERAA